jgi:hypothetical protein
LDFLTVLMLSDLSCLLLVNSLDLIWLHADRILKPSVQRYTSSFLRLSSKRVSLYCVKNLYLSVATETLLYALLRNRCLCHNLGDVFQQAVT